MDLDLIDAHLENAIMEETDIDVEVNVSEGEIAEQVDEAVEERAEMDDVVAEQSEEVAEDEVTEMMFRQVDHMMAVVAKHGVSRDIMAAFDTNGSLAKMIEKRMGTSVYVESLDATGDPNSAMTIATLEGLGEMAKKAWDWIKKIFRKIFAFMGRMVSAIMTRFGNAEKTIGRLRKEYAARSGYADMESKKEVYDYSKVMEYLVAASADVDKARNFADIIGKESDKLVAEGKSGTTASDVESQALKKADEEFKKMLEALDSKRSAAKSGKVKATSVNWNNLQKGIDMVLTINKTIMSLKQQMEKIRVRAKHSEQDANRVANTGVKGDEANNKAVKSFREAATADNRAASKMTKIVSHIITAQSMVLSILNSCIMLGKKS